MKSPEMPHGENLGPVEDMDMAAIEDELKSRKISTPPRWFFYTEEQKRSVLQDAREGKILPGQEQPVGDRGDRSFFDEKK